MRVLKRSPWLGGLGLMLVVLAFSMGRAGADVTSDQPGSIVIYPKVIADGTRDTLIELANTSNLPRRAHCFYLDGLGTCEINGTLCSQDVECPDYVGGERCLATWQEHDFPLTLTSQQPTVWQVSTGRIIDPSDPANGTCSNTCSDTGLPCTAVPPSCGPTGTCIGSCPGIDPGSDSVLGGASVPPMGFRFRGELKCFQVDDSDVPIGANSLKGEAVLVSPGAGQVSKYNALAILGTENIGDDWVLSLNNTEYNACPAYLEFTHYADLASDIVIGSMDASACNEFGVCSGGANPRTPCTVGGGECTGGGSCHTCPVRTEITLVPCTENFVNLNQRLSVNALFDVYDEQEGRLSTGATVACWYNSDITNVGDGGNVFGSMGAGRGTFLRTKIWTAGTMCLAGPNVNLANCTTDDDCGGAALGGVCGPTPGLLGVVEEFHETDGSLAGALRFLAASNASTMRMSREVREGLCRGTTTACSSDADCATGLCHVDGVACTVDSDCLNIGPDKLNNCDKCLIDSISYIIP